MIVGTIFKVGLEESSKKRAISFFVEPYVKVNVYLAVWLLTVLKIIPIVFLKKTTPQLEDFFFYFNKVMIFLAVIISIATWIYYFFIFSKKLKNNYFQFDEKGVIFFKENQKILMVPYENISEIWFDANKSIFMPFHYTFKNYGIGHIKFKKNTSDSLYKIEFLGPKDEVLQEEIMHQYTIFRNQKVVN